MKRYGILIAVFCAATVQFQVQAIFSGKTTKALKAIEKARTYEEIKAAVDAAAGAKKIDQVRKAAAKRLMEIATPRGVYLDTSKGSLSIAKFLEENGVDSKEAQAFAKKVFAPVDPQGRAQIMFRSGVIGKFGGEDTYQLKEALKSVNGLSDEAKQKFLDDISVGRQQVLIDGKLTSLADAFKRIGYTEQRAQQEIIALNNADLGKDSLGDGGKQALKDSLKDGSQSDGLDKVHAQDMLVNNLDQKLKNKELGKRVTIDGDKWLTAAQKLQQKEAVRKDILKNLDDLDNQLISDGIGSDVARLIVERTRLAVLSRQQNDRLTDLKSVVQEGAQREKVKVSQVLDGAQSQAQATLDRKYQNRVAEIESAFDTQMKQAKTPQKRQETKRQYEQETGIEYSGYQRDTGRLKRSGLPLDDVKAQLVEMYQVEIQTSLKEAEEMIKQGVISEKDFKEITKTLKETIVQQTKAIKLSAANDTSIDISNELTDYINQIEKNVLEQKKVTDKVVIEDTGTPSFTALNQDEAQQGDAILSTTDAQANTSEGQDEALNNQPVVEQPKPAQSDIKPSGQGADPRHSGKTFGTGDDGSAAQEKHQREEDQGGDHHGDPVTTYDDMEDH